MLKKKSIAFMVICLAFVFTVAFLGVYGYTVVGAEAVEPEIEVAADDENAEASPRGLFTTISLSISAGNNAVKAVAHNDFTLGPSTIETYVELYYSYTYCVSYNDMILAGSNYTADLNIFESLEVSVSTNGEQKYWQALVRYQLDNQDWVVKTTSTILFDASGKEIN